MSTLTVRREKGWTDKLRKYRIVLDGVEIGQLGEGAELRTEITSGPHLLQARIDWCGSLPLLIPARSEEKVVIVRSALRGWRLFLAPFCVLFNSQAYLTLELEP